MKRYSWFALFFVFFIFYCLNCNVFAAKELYDDFSGTYIDSQKWDSRELVREIVAGKLLSKIGNDMFTSNARNNTSFQNPSSIDVIKCDITVVATNLDDGTNSKSFVRVAGRFYNALNSGTEKGDIWAAIFIGDRGSDLEAWWEVWESLDDEGDNWEEKESGTLIVPGLAHGHSYTVKLEYNGANQFTFEVGGVMNDQPFTGPARQGTEFLAYKGLETGVSSDGGSGIGYASALFDNVYINDEATAYDTFDSAPLDNDYWKSLETVREISDGKLRMNAQADGATKTQGVGLTNYDTSYLEAKVAVKSDSLLSPGALAFTRIDGWFYNDSHGPGSGQDYNGYEGNIHAQTRIMLHDDLSMVATAAVFRSDDPSSSSATKLFSKDFTTPISFDRPYTLSIEFTDSTYIFKCGDDEIPPNVETLNYSVVSPAYKPYNEGRWLVSRVYADPGETGYMKVDFDDIYTAEAVAFCEGDFGNDGDVDGSDLAVFAADFGRTNCMGDCEGDFDFDGDVDGSDLAVFAADFGRTDCPAIPPYTWRSYGGHLYALTHNWGTWAQAEAEAQAAGGHLVTINDEVENEWLTNTFDVYTRTQTGQSEAHLAWIGYYRESESDPWQWISGQSVTYTNYYYGWPEGGDEARYTYLHLFNHVDGAGTWNTNPWHNDDFNGNPKGIIEIEP